MVKQTLDLPFFRFADPADRCFAIFICKTDHQIAGPLILYEAAVGNTDLGPLPVDRIIRQRGKKFFRLAQQKRGLRQCRRRARA